MVDQRLLNELNLCYTKRWVIAPMMRDQSVAEHCYRVQALVRIFRSQLISDGKGAFDLERAILLALDHDNREAIEGDMPGVAKDESGHKWDDPHSLMEWEVAVKVADALESFHWWYTWGNRGWVHPHCPPISWYNRDMRKVRWFCQGWVSLREVVLHTMVHYLGIPGVLATNLLQKEEPDGKESQVDAAH